MNKFISFSVSICFVFSIMFVSAGCAKKAPVPSVAPKEKAAVEQPSLSEEPLAGSPGETLPGPSGEAGEEFQAVPGSSISREFTATPDLSAVHFDFDRYDIKPEDQAILNRNAAWLLDHPNTFVKIEGHCDSRGTLDYNLALGDKRAHAIKSYLISLGVDSSKISPISYGEERPLCPERNESCWSQNRRGEFLTAE